MPTSDNTPEGLVPGSTQYALVRLLLPGETEIYFEPGTELTVLDLPTTESAENPGVTLYPVEVSSGLNPGHRLWVSADQVSIFPPFRRFHEAERYPGFIKFEDI